MYTHVERLLIFIHKRKNNDISLSDHNPCRLACRSGGTFGFYGNVLDGTQCSENPYVYDVCIEGECKVYGHLEFIIRGN